MGFFGTNEQPSCRLSCYRLPIQPRLVERYRTDTTERCVTANSIVEDLDVFKHVSTRCVARFVAHSMHALVLQAVEEALARRVVPAIAFAAHRREHSVFGELLLKIVAAILTAAIRMMNQPRQGRPTEPCH